MNNQKIEEKIRTAVDHSVPDVLDGILSGCEQKERRVIPLTEAGKRGRKRWMPAASVAAVMLLIAGAVFGMNWNASYAVDSVVALDVNPGVQLEVNKKERVIRAEAQNSDGRDILDGMDLSGSDLNVAVNALIGSMLKNGYIDELANSILVTVGSDDKEKAAKLQEKIVAEINAILSASSVDGAILSQNLDGGRELSELAGRYGISTGKAALIRDMVQQNPLWKFEDLAGLSINELNLLAASKHTEFANVQSQGQASDKAYIGVEAAKRAALSHAGLSASQVAMKKVEFDWEAGRAEYEVEFWQGSMEYEYDIDALTGEVRKFEKEQDDERASYSGVGSLPGQSSQSSQSGLSGQGGTGGADSSGNNGGNNGGNGGGTSAQSTYIGEAAAKKTALSHTGLSSSNATFTKLKLDEDDGRMIYELEFYSGNLEYEYEIDATSGTVMDFDQDSRENVSYDNDDNDDHGGDDDQSENGDHDGDDDDDDDDDQERDDD